MGLNCKVYKVIKWKVLMLSDLLLVGDLSFHRSFASARIGLRALTAHRQTATMPISAIGTDFLKALDIQQNALSQISFGREFFHLRANFLFLVFRQVVGSGVLTDLELLQY